MDLANETFKKNISIWYDEYLNNGLDAIISNTSGCGTTLKDYGFIFRSDENFKKKSKKISELTKDISEYLDENVKLNFIQNKENNKKYQIAYHSACSMQHGQKIHEAPINLLKKTGNKVFNIPDGHLCCGSAGTYNLLQGDIAKKLLRNKIFADAFGRDPEFFAFYRAMQAYETALIGGDTSLILSPDSEFFKFFGNIKPQAE